MVRPEVLLVALVCSHYFGRCVTLGFEGKVELPFLCACGGGPKKFVLAIVGCCTVGCDS